MPQNASTSRFEGQNNCGRTQRSMSNVMIVLYTNDSVIKKEREEMPQNASTQMIVGQLCGDTSSKRENKLLQYFQSDAGVHY